MTHIKRNKYPHLSDVETVVKELVNRVREILNKLEIERRRAISEDVDYMWRQISELYYEYEDDAWKRAFREVFFYISEKIQEDKWPTIYMNLYRREQRKVV